LPHGGAPPGRSGAPRRRLRQGHPSDRPDLDLSPVVGSRTSFFDLDRNIASFPEAREGAMPIRDEIRSANERYASTFEKGHLPMPPGRRFAVVTCMDARLDPAKFLGLEEGYAHVIRNAGGLVTDDALRSLVISRNLLGTEEVFVIAHSDCGMLTFSDEALQEQLGTDLAFHAFSDVDESV